MIITKHTIMFPTRFAVTRMANIVVIPICADSESVYSDMMGVTVTTSKKRKTREKNGKAQYKIDKGRKRSSQQKSPLPQQVLLKS